MKSKWILKKPKRVENPVEEADIGGEVDELLEGFEESSSARGAERLVDLVCSLHERELRLKDRQSDKREGHFVQVNQNHMRKSELLASEYFQMEANKDKLHKLRETLSNKHSDHIERLEETARMQNLQNSSKNKELFEDLNKFSRNLEQTTKNSVEGVHRNEYLKQEFRSFYEIYQREESKFEDDLEERGTQIEKLSQQKEVKETMVKQEQMFLSPLEDKLLAAQQKEATLKAKLQDMAAKFEMFTGLLNDSNGKFSSIKNEMNSKTEFSRSLTFEISEFKKRIAQTNVLLEPTNAENFQTGESINKIEKQIEQLNSLTERLRAQNS